LGRIGAIYFMMHMLIIFLNPYAYGGEYKRKFLMRTPSIHLNFYACSLWVCSVGYNEFDFFYKLKNTL
jgi:hypothetical protein